MNLSEFFLLLAESSPTSWQDVILFAIFIAFLAFATWLNSRP
jgi:hypothetical protein